MPDDLNSQAIVITMLRYNIDAEAAQALVKRLSTHQQLPITDVASRPHREILRTRRLRTRPEPKPAHGRDRPSTSFHTTTSMCDLPP